MIFPVVILMVTGLVLGADEGNFHRPIRVNETDYNPVELPDGYNAGKIKRPTLINPADLERSLTLHYINQYASPGGLEWLRSVMENGAPYLGFIRNELRERNLPEELLYLPVIESGYLATAVSTSGAMGLWQFMKNSIDPFGIRVNEWMDERRDFWKSTQGALRKLAENYAMFGDWPLALAAYNAGYGSISGIVRNTGIKDYWLLSERKLIANETIHYVPKLLAVAHILSNARKYGIVLWQEEIEWTRIALDKSIDLNILARESGIDPAALRRANQELTYNITPPENGYYLKVMTQDYERAAAVLARNDLSFISYYIHTVRSGDTLLHLAIHYGVSVGQITSLNPGVTPELLRIGSTLMIPAVKEQTPFVQNIKNEYSEFIGDHVVARGETLWSISRSFGITPEELAQANGMEINDILREGRTLKTPIRKQ